MKIYIATSALHELTKKLINRYGIDPKTLNENQSVGRGGDGSWVGWSHRAVHCFKIGSKCKKGDCAYDEERGEWVAKTDEDAKKMAQDFAESVSSSFSSARCKNFRADTETCSKGCAAEKVKPGQACPFDNIEDNNETLRPQSMCKGYR